MAKEVPAAAQVAVIVVGIVGCAATHHPVNAGWSVLLFERKKLTSGGTWHDAGLVSDSQGVPVMSTLAIMELRLRDFLAGLPGANLLNSAVPFATWQDLHVGQRQVRSRNVRGSGLDKGLLKRAEK